MLADGGLYVIEDVQTSYWPQWKGSLDLDDPTTTMAMVKRLLDGLNHEEFLDDDYEPSYTDLHVTACTATTTSSSSRRATTARARTSTSPTSGGTPAVRRPRPPRSSQSRNTAGPERCTAATRDVVRRNCGPWAYPHRGGWARPTVSARSAPTDTLWRFHGRLLRLDDRGDGPRPDDDHAGARPVLRRHDPLQVRAQHDDDVLRRHGGRRHRLRAVGLVRGLGRRRCRQRQRQADRQPVHDVRAARRHQRQLHLRALPAHLRGDHRGAHLGRDRRPREALLLDGLPADLGHALLLPDRPQRLGRRLVLLPLPEPGLRGRHGRAHQRRYRRRHPGPGHRPAHGLHARPDEAAQPDADDDRRRSAVVRLVRLQRRLDRVHLGLAQRPRQVLRPVLQRDRRDVHEHHGRHHGRHARAGC